MAVQDPSIKENESRLQHLHFTTVVSFLIWSLAMRLSSPLLIFSIIGTSLAAPGIGSHSLVGEREYSLVNIVHRLIYPLVVCI